MRKIIIISILAGLLASCSTWVDDLNDNPNSPTTATYQYILTGAEVGNILLHSGETARKAGLFCGYLTGLDRSHLNYWQYNFSTSSFNSEWNNVYVDVLANVIAAMDEAEAEEIGGITIGILQTLKAMALGHATAVWGDIPFDDGGMTEIANPEFEDQLTVYGKIQTLLDEALTNLSSGSGRPASGSEVYLDGDPEAWMEVVNTLKARFYMHTKEYEQAYNAALTGISAPENSLMGPHGDALDNSNLYYQFFALGVRQTDIVVSDFISAMVSPDSATYRGNAKTNEAGRFNYLFELTGNGLQPNLTDGFAAQDAPAPLVTYQENLLILAEAGARSQDFATGLTHLNQYRAFLAAGGYMDNADLANVQYDAYEAADFESGGMENADGLSTDNALLREILEERYVTFFGLIEGFNDMRRTQNESQVRVPVQPNVGNQLPQRFLYPASEIDRNENIPEVIPDAFTPTTVNQ